MTVDRSPPTVNNEYITQEGEIKMTQEIMEVELKKQIKELQDKQQNDFINKLLTDVEWLLEKSAKKSYEPTQHERDTFNRIRQIINNMNSWF